jgi:hypothetical protein
VELFCGNLSNETCYFPTGRHQFSGTTGNVLVSTAECRNNSPFDVGKVNRTISEEFV